jgi:hypothetical protein
MHEVAHVTPHWQLMIEKSPTMLLSSDSGKTNRSPLPVKAAKFRVVPGGQVLARVGPTARRAEGLLLWE